MYMYTHRHTSDLLDAPLLCCAVLCAVCYMLYAICYMLYVICYMLHVICYMLCVICYMLNAACYIILSYNTVGFHNFNLRIFSLRVSNPNKLIVDVFLTRCRISMCQGLGPKKHDEISEIDRMFARRHSSGWQVWERVLGAGLLARVKQDK